MAEISIATTDATRSRYAQDDVTAFQNTAQILNANTERIVQSPEAGWSWGVEPNKPGCLRDQYLASICRYKFVRRSKHEIDRVDLSTNQSVRIVTGQTVELDGRPVSMDVNEFIRRRCRNRKHNIFATQNDFSDAYYYGVATAPSVESLASVWSAIEAALPSHQIGDNKKTLFQTARFRKYLVLRSHDLWQSAIDDLLSPVMIFNEVTNEQVKVERCQFRGVLERLGLPSWSQVRDPFSAPDYRDIDTFIVDDITERKEVLFAMKYKLLIDELNNDPASIGYKLGADWKPETEIASLLNAKSRTFYRAVQNAELVKWAANASRWAKIEDAASVANVNKQVRSIAKAALRLLEPQSGPLDVNDQAVIGMIDALVSAGVLSDSDKSGLLAIASVTNGPRWQEIGVTDVDVTPQQVRAAFSMMG